MPTKNTKKRTYKPRPHAPTPRLPFKWGGRTYDLLTLAQSQSYKPSFDIDTALYVLGTFEAGYKVRESARQLVKTGMMVEVGVDQWRITKEGTEALHEGASRQKTMRKRNGIPEDSDL